MKDIENADGIKEDKVKLIRSESIGEYSWGNKASGPYVSMGANGSNDWSDSELQKVLNEGAYWNRTSGNCPNGNNGSTTTCDFSNTGLTEESKNMISDSVWNLGGSTQDDVTTKTFYERERGTKVYSGHATKWTGKVGLMYPSDYGYATGGGATTDRNACLNTSLYSWSGSGISDCRTSDWLHKSNVYQWTITPYFNYNDGIFNVRPTGRVDCDYSEHTYAASPSIYLNSDIVIENGSDGSSTSPFVLK